MTHGLAGAPATDARWRLNPILRLHFRPLDGGWVVFEQLSGQVHAMDNLAAAALTCMEPGLAFDAPALQAALDAQFGIRLADAGAVHGLLRQFQQLGMLVPETQAHIGLRHVAG